jgi:hypothetical protein
MMKKFISDDRKKFQTVARLYSRMTDLYYINWVCLCLIIIRMLIDQQFYMLLLINIVIALILHVFIDYYLFPLVCKRLYNIDEENRLRKINDFNLKKYGKID